MAPRPQCHCAHQSCHAQPSAWKLLAEAGLLDALGHAAAKMNAASNFLLMILGASNAPYTSTLAKPNGKHTARATTANNGCR
jgi:hypothetical protein